MRTLAFTLALSITTLSEAFAANFQPLSFRANSSVQFVRFGSHAVARLAGRCLDEIARPPSFSDEFKHVSDMTLVLKWTDGHSTTHSWADGALQPGVPFQISVRGSDVLMHAEWHIDQLPPEIDSVTLQTGAHPITAPDLAAFRQVVDAGPDVLELIQAFDPLQARAEEIFDHDPWPRGGRAACDLEDPATHR